MRSRLLPAALIASTLAAQGFDPVRSATGWAKLDKDGSATFYDAPGQTLRSWSRDAGDLGSVSLARLEGAPEKWVVDSYGNAWVVSGGVLFNIEAKTGKVLNREKLPGEVSDLAWDLKGFVLAYRGGEPFLEKREYRGGSVLWTYGSKPRKGGPAFSHRVAVTDDGQVLVTSGANLTLTTLDGAKGKAMGQTAFSFNGIAAPDLILGEAERGPLVVWPGRNVALSAVGGRQVPEAKMSGALLAKLDLSQSSVEFLPTGLSEDHVLVGVQEGQAVFIKPGGGLVMVALR